MEKLDILIKKLQEAKEELVKASKKKKPSDEDAYAPVPAKDMPDDKKLQGSPKAGIPPIAKNVNMSYGSAPNMAKEDMEKDAKNPALAPKEVKIKELQGKIDAGKYKPDAGKIAGKMVERGVFNKCGQWSMQKWNMDKKDWEDC